MRRVANLEKRVAVTAYEYLGQNIAMEMLIKKVNKEIVLPVTALNNVTLTEE
jgi:hypothetical protein